MPKPPSVADRQLDLDELAMESVRRKAETREDYAYFHTWPSDTEGSRRARQIVERAIESMGGMEALVAIDEMKVAVWIELSYLTRYRREGNSCIGMIFPTPPRAYSVGTWHFSGWVDFASEHGPLDRWIGGIGGCPGPFDSQLANYHAMFRDGPYATPWAKSVRPERPNSWHFVDRFLGEAVVLDYIKSEYRRGRLMHVLHVKDRKAGAYFLAYFDERTGLLTGTLDKFRRIEEKQYLERTGRRPREIYTEYSDYREVQGVLSPHRLKRGLQVIYLSIAYSTEEPGDSIPDAYLDSH